MTEELKTGKGPVRGKAYRPFDEARAFVHALKLNTIAEWTAFSKGMLPAKGRRPNDIPSNPYKIYAGLGWNGWGAWLGTGRVTNRNRTFRPFEEARAFVHKLKLKKAIEWIAYSQDELKGKARRPADIPANPSEFYKDKGWQGMPDWLGPSNANYGCLEFLDYEKAAKFVHGLKLKNSQEWRAYCQGKLEHLGRRPPMIPALPALTYAKSGWRCMGDWLGTGSAPRPPRTYRSFKSARAYVRKLGLKNENEWRAYCRGERPQLGRKPDDIPVAADRIYAGKGWKGIADWLGSSGRSRRESRPFYAARAFARELKLASGKEWYRYCHGELPDKGQRPEDIPIRPDAVYLGKGWQGYHDWLGVGFMPFRAARAFVRRLLLGSHREWRAYCHGLMPQLKPKPANIPISPYRVYAGKGWKGIGDWLGKTGVG